jgi:CheY-like chemotaxis protein
MTTINVIMEDAFHPMTAKTSQGSSSDQSRIDCRSQSRDEAGEGPMPTRASSQGVLVVDDDQDIREALCELLRDEGYEAVAVANGQEALTYLRSGKAPCVILLDLMMPVMDGWEFRRRQTSDPELSKIPVIIISAAGGLRASSIAAEKVLAKPLHLDQVLDVLQQYC